MAANDKNNPEVQLKVEEAFKEDHGRGIIRIDSKVRELLGVGSGDVVEIEGKKRTAARVWPLYPMDENRNIIRMDGLIRQNAGVGIGDKVKVRKAEVKDAKKVVFSPVIPISFHPSLVNALKSYMLGRVVTKGDMIIRWNLGRQLRFFVSLTMPKGIVRITENTQVEITEEPIQEMEDIPSVTYEDIGGLKEQVAKIREMVELPLRYPVLFEKLGIEPPKGVLLYGPPGTGKTLLAKAVANEANAHFIAVNGPEIMSKWYGESEKKLRDIFKEASKNPPTIIFIDEIDAIAPKREETYGEVERRVVSQLLTLMDGLTARGDVIVIAATNRPNAIDPALRRPGRFDREIEIPVPDREGRLEILKIHTRNMPLEDVDLEKLADKTHGFTGADIAQLAREAAMRALRKILPEIDWEKEEVSPEVLDKIKVTMDDFVEAINLVTPSALREVFIEVPDVRWDDIGDLTDVKKELKEVVEWPMKYPDSFEKLGIRPIKGVLLTGPPGCGKTLLAKAVATESNANFISIKGPSIFSKWVGESEKAIRETFRKARQAAPCIVFIDEIDAIAPIRGMETGNAVTERIVNQLLTEMDGIENTKGVIVIGATNRPDIIDPALLRPGRFDRIVLVSPPDVEGRLSIFKVHTRNMPLASDVNLEVLANKTEGYSGADIEAVCREAALAALRESKEAKEVKMKHFDQALERVKPSIDPSVIQFYQQYMEDTKKITKRKRNSPNYYG